MGKSKEELKEALSVAKEEAKAAREEKRGFEKENKLAKGEDHSANEKVGKKWTKLNDVVTAKTAKVEKAQAALDEVKKESTGSRTTYEYPKDVVSPGDRKKYRAAQRAAKKKAAKGEGDAAAPKKSKKSAEAPAEEVKAEKKVKKAKKEKVEAED